MHVATIFLSHKHFILATPLAGPDDGTCADFPIAVVHKDGRNEGRIVADGTRHHYHDTHIEY